MSIEQNTCEFIRVKAIDEPCKRIINRICNKIKDLNVGSGIESGHISYIKLTVDGESAEYRHLNIGLGDSRENLWDDGADIIRLIGRDNIETLELQLDFSAIVFSESYYGSFFMQDLIETEDKATLSNIEYKVLEYYDTEDYVLLSRLNNGEQEDAPAVDFSKDITPVCNWYSNNFLISLTKDDEFTEDEENALIELGNAFANKYYEDYEVDEPYYGEFIIERSLPVKTDDLQSFKNDLDAFVAYASANGIDLELCAQFVADDKEQQYARMWFEIEENKTVIKSAYFS